MRLFVNILSYWLMLHVRFLLVRAYRCDWFWIIKTQKLSTGNIETVDNFCVNVCFCICQKRTVMPMLGSSVPLS